MTTFKKPKEADNIKKFLRERSLRKQCDHTRFEIEFQDGSVRTEHDTDWNHIGKLREVHLGENRKVIKTCTVPIRSLRVVHGTMVMELEARPGEELYQATRGSQSLTTDGRVVTSIVGKTIGRIKNNNIVEEYFLDGRTNEIVRTK